LVHAVAVLLEFPFEKPMVLESWKCKTEVLLNVFFIVVQLAWQVKEVSTARHGRVARFPHSNG